MSSKEKIQQISQTKLLEKRSNKNIIKNNNNSYTLKKYTIEKTVNSFYNTNNNKNTNINQSNYSKYQAYTENQRPLLKNKSQTIIRNTGQSNNIIYPNKDIQSYEYLSGISTIPKKINLKHHPNQVNNLIHNHTFYTSNTSNSTKTINIAKSSKTIRTTSTKTEINKKVQNLSPNGNTSNTIETRKVEFYNKPRSSIVSDSSRETNITISIDQIKKLMTNMWLENIYCSNVESLSCLVDNNKRERNSYYLAEMYEKEIEKKSKIIKDYESEIINLKNILNIKEQEMKQLVQNLKKSESTNKIKNKQIYELNIKRENEKEQLYKDLYQAQMISEKQHEKKNIKLGKDAYSLQIISMKKGWNNINIPSPVNEIYIETVKHESPLNSQKYEEMRKIQKIKEEEEILIKKKLENKFKFVIQEMGLLSIITKKPKKINIFQHLQSISILSKAKILPLKFQKIEDINITSQIIKIENEIQELDGLEIINIKNKKELILQEQCLNGLEIPRDYDMLLVKPVWNSLQIQGTGLNLISMKKEVELENQEIDEFEILGVEKPEKILEKINSFKIIGKIRMKPVLKINNERIKLLGMPRKEDINWNNTNKLIKTNKLLLKRSYEKMEQDIKIDWNEILKPIKTTILFVKGVSPKEKDLEMVNKDKLNFIYSSPVKNSDEFGIENFNINIINTEKKINESLKIFKAGFNIKGLEMKKINESLKMFRAGFNIKGIEKKNIILIKNKIDQINIFGLTKKINLIPSSSEKLYIISEFKSTDWNKNNKVMKVRDLNIPRKNKIQNKISKKVVNIEIKTIKKLILNPIKEAILFIRGKKTELKKNSQLKPILVNKLLIQGIKNVQKRPEIALKQRKENKIFIRGIKKEEKPIIDWNNINKLKKENTIKLIGRKPIKIDWNELIKIDKKPIINIINKTNPKKSILKKQSIYKFSFKGIRDIEKDSFESIEILSNNWANSIKAQRNAKFSIKGIIKDIKLLIVKPIYFMIKREQEEEIIYNDDYNYLIQTKKENGKEKSINEKNDKLLVIKEKEITPILHREIRAQVVQVKEDTSETSSQSDVDILEGIKKQKIIGFTSDKEKTISGFKKKFLKSEVIFTPKVDYGVDLGGAKFKKEVVIKKGLKLDTINKIDHNNLSCIESKGSNGESHYERTSGITSVAKEGSYKIINENINGNINNKLNAQKKLTAISQSSSNIRKNNKLSKFPNDSKKKKTKKQLVIRSKINLDKKNETLSFCKYNNNPFFDNSEIQGHKKVIDNPNSTIGNIKLINSNFGLRDENQNFINMKKEEIYTYEHIDNGKIINKIMKKQMENSQNLNK